MRTQTQSTEKLYLEQLAYFTDKVRRYVHWDETLLGLPNIRLTQSGIARFAATCGFIDMVECMGRTEEAQKLAVSLWDKLEYLSSFGGKEPLSDQPADSGYIPRASKYKVCLSDDGTFAGFSLAWFRLIPPGGALTHASVDLEEVIWPVGCLQPSALHERGRHVRTS